MRNKQSKIQQQRRKKLNLMITFFWRSNIFFLIKIILIFLLTLAYYIIDLLMYNSNITSYLEFDDMNDNLCNVYADSI